MEQMGLKINTEKTKYLDAASEIFQNKIEGILEDLFGCTVRTFQIT